MSSVAVPLGAQALDLHGDLSHGSLAPRVELVRLLLRQRGTLTSQGRPVAWFFVQAPLVSRSGFLRSRGACEQVLDRALRESLTYLLDCKRESGETTPPMV